MSRTLRFIAEIKLRQWWANLPLHVWRRGITQDEWVEYDHIDRSGLGWRGIPQVDRRILHKKERRQTKDALHTRQFNRIPQPRKDKDWW